MNVAVSRERRQGGENRQRLTKGDGEPVRGETEDVPYFEERLRARVGAAASCAERNAALVSAGRETRRNGIRCAARARRGEARIRTPIPGGNERGSCAEISGLRLLIREDAGRGQDEGQEFGPGGLPAAERQRKTWPAARAYALKSRKLDPQKSAARSARITPAARRTSGEHEISRPRMVKGKTALASLPAAAMKRAGVMALPR